MAQAFSGWPSWIRTPSAAGGFLGALTTLAMLAVMDPFGGVDPAERGFELAAGDCVDVVSGSGDGAVLGLVDCEQPHDAQITGRVEHDEAGGPYPGPGPIEAWFDEQCDDVNADYLGTDVLDTTLGWGTIRPTGDEWDDGVHHGVCYLTTASPDDELAGSVGNGGLDYARGDRVPVNRLKPGDCFDPVRPEQDAIGLLSTDIVALVDCNDSFRGVFFGRGRLAFPPDEPLPDSDVLTATSTEACAREFEQYFQVAAAGSNYRFWRPAASAWAAGDRTVLCAVLSNDPIPGRYEPASYPTLYDLPSSACFDLGPEQTAETLWLDDRVRPVDCASPHRGQKLGSGVLSVDDQEPYPGPRATENRTKVACENRFEDFVGIERVRSRYSEFPYWYPDSETWQSGDRRYTCAVLEEGLVGSLEGVRR